MPVKLLIALVIQMNPLLSRKSNLHLRLGMKLKGKIHKVIRRITIKRMSGTGLTIRESLNKMKILLMLLKSNLRRSTSLVKDLSILHLVIADKNVNSLLLVIVDSKTNVNTCTVKVQLLVNIYHCQLLKFPM